MTERFEVIETVSAISLAKYLLLRKARLNGSYLETIELLHSKWRREGSQVGNSSICLAQSIIQAVGLVLTVKGLRVEFSPQACGLGLVSISSPLLFQTN